MSKYILILSPTRIQKRDYERFGVKFLKTKKKVAILDLSNLLKNRSILIYKKKKYLDVTEINSFKELISFIRNKKNSYAFDYLGNSFNEIIIKFILIYFKIKVVKYTGGIKPPILYNHIDINNKILKKDQRTTFEKAFDIHNVFLRFIKNKLINLINSYYINTAIITGQNTQDFKTYIDNAKKKLFSNSFDYNHYIDLLRIKKRVSKKKYIVYLDQDLFGHPDFFIKKRKPIVDKKFYLDINKFLFLIKKKYKCEIKIALHPKSKIKKNFFSKEYDCYLNRTGELVKESKHVIMHYSTAVSFGVLFKKPITFLTSDNLNRIRPGAKITYLAYLLKSQLINIDRFKKTVKLKKNFDKKSYNNFTNQYIKHPKSTGENSWKYLLKNIN